MTTEKPTAEELATALDTIRQAIEISFYWPFSMQQAALAADMLRSQSITIREQQVANDMLRESWKINVTGVEQQNVALLKELNDAKAEIEQLKSAVGRGIGCKVLSKGVECRCKLCTAEWELSVVREQLKSERQESRNLRESLRELDGTPYAHPAGHRGSDHATASLCQEINEILAGQEIAGTASEPWESTRTRIADMRDRLDAVHKLSGQR